jgi:pimeloyl-ACP methyl ester carboxylesterase
VRTRVQIDASYATTVRDEGRGSAVVLVHGTPLDARSWDGLVPRLATRHRVVTYDLRGHGSASSCQVPGDYDRFVRDLVLLLDWLELERAHLVGHSFGGQVVEAFAGSHPDRVEALTVVCGRSTPYPPFAAAADAIERDGIEGAVEGALGRWFTPEAVARDDPAVRYARSCMTSEAAPALVATFRLIAGFDVGDRLAGLPAPARLIAAEHDVVATPEDSRQAARSAANGEFMLEPAAGHMLPLEFPERIARLAY